eukprot:8704236-Alexandrium_andersonii.AAC.1
MCIRDRLTAAFAPQLQELLQRAVRAPAARGRCRRPLGLATRCRPLGRIAPARLGSARRTCADALIPR